MRDSVPSASYSSVCNVLRQCNIRLIPTYRVYRLYDIVYMCVIAVCIYDIIMEAFCPVDQQKWRRTLGLICDCWDDGLGQTGSSVLCFLGMNLLVQNHNHYTTARAIFSVVQ